MFILAGMIFERLAWPSRLVRFSSRRDGRRMDGLLAVVAVLVSMLLGGISGSGPADAAVAAVMLPSMIARGYPKGFEADRRPGSTAIVIPPSVAFIVHSVMVPAATVPALFAAGLFPGIVAALCLLVPAIVISRKYGFGRLTTKARARRSARAIEAIWGLRSAGDHPRRPAHWHLSRPGGGWWRWLTASSSAWWCIAASASGACSACWSRPASCRRWC